MRLDNAARRGRRGKRLNLHDRAGPLVGRTAYIEEGLSGGTGHGFVRKEAIEAPILSSRRLPKLRQGQSTDGWRRFKRIIPLGGAAHTLGDG